MNDLELIFSMLGEKATTEITRNEDSLGMPKLQSDAKRGGGVAGDARNRLENELGRPVVSDDNYLQEPEAVKRLEGKS